MLLETITTLIIALLSTCEAQDDKIVTLNQGAVRGYKALGKEVYEFYGIPYATPPTGTEKFKAPLPAPKWEDTLEAINYNVVCPQHQYFAQNLNVTENCLVANVFAPSTHVTNLPVVVYIHGGAFFHGDGMLLSPRPLVESQRVVAVTFNYRLGVHGFLCLGTEDIPGNAGLKDMLAALRWVKENIAHFGGNPEDVTLAGFSAGASSADLLSLSKGAKGLFNKLILESGAHVAGWSVQRDPIKNAQEYAKKHNSGEIGSLSALEEFYKTASYDVLFSDTTMLPNYNSDLVFVPCIENDLGQERILDDSPINVIKSNDYAKLPALYGFANMEGIFRMPNFDEWAPKMNENFSEFLPGDLNFEDEIKKKEVAQTIKEFYFGSNTVGLYTLFDYINFYTDVMYAYPILRSVNIQLEAGNEQIFLYEYTFYNQYLPVPGVADILTNFPGADHCAQSIAVLEGIRNSNEERYTEEYRQVRANLRQLWVNFITSGTPVLQNSSFPDWPPVNASRTPHMILGETIELKGALNEDRAVFWDAIYDKYYRDPIPPTFVEHEDNNAYMLSANIILNFILICIFFVSY